MNWFDPEFQGLYKFIAVSLACLIFAVWIARAIARTGPAPGPKAATPNVQPQARPNTAGQPGERVNAGAPAPGSSEKSPA